MTTENRRILIIDDERSDPDDARGIAQPPRLPARDRGQCRPRDAMLCKSKAPARRPARSATAGCRWPGNARTDQDANIPETQVIILTAHDSLNNAIESIKRGAYHFISKPYAPEELLSLVEKALEKQSLLRETSELREKTQQLEKRLRNRGNAARAGFQEQGDAANRRVDHCDGAVGGERAHHRAKAASARK